MIKNAYQLGVVLALEALGLVKTSSEDLSPDASMPEGGQSVPAEALAKIMKDLPEQRLSRRAEAVSEPGDDLDVLFGVTTSSYSPAQSWGLDIRGPTDTSV
jgi:hypothetical protein